MNELAVQNHFVFIVGGLLYACNENGNILEIFIFNSVHFDITKMRNN